MEMETSIALRFRISDPTVLLADCSRRFVAFFVGFLIPVAICICVCYVRLFFVGGINIYWKRRISNNPCANGTDLRVIILFIYFIFTALTMVKEIHCEKARHVFSQPNIENDWHLPIHPFFGYRKNHRITPAAHRRVEQQAVSDFYWLKTSMFLQLPMCRGARCVFFGSRDPGSIHPEFAW